MVVTVDRLLTDVSGRSAMSTGALSSIGQPLPYGQFVSMPVLRHRTVVRYSTCRLAGYGTRHDDNLPEPGGADTLGTVLVVDPGPAGNGTPCLSALAACSLAQRLGFTSAVISLTPDDYPILDIAGDQVDLVVLVVGVEPTNGPSNWSSSTWSIPARVAGAYRSLGVDVLAVGAGAGAGALAACVEQGASALPDIDGLTEELRSMFGEQGGAASAKEDLRRIPARFEALMQLTASERRVLYFLTKGISAQDIATELVVSLATVRSHIRSILRKLGVRSQLAAVAMANGRDLEDAVGIETPKPLACP
jgi:DNA-binding CsgD family transcriptional regulator